MTIVRSVAVTAACFFALLAASLPMAAATNDVKLDSDLLSSLSFRNIDPKRGGRVTAVSGVIGDYNTYYMGATGGGVWKTTNGGQHWFNISDGQFQTGSVGAIAVAESDANIIVVGMGEAPFRGVASSYGDGVYKSMDAGKTWTHLGLEKTRQISGVVIHPKNPDIILVAAQGAAWNASIDRGIYKSIDGGKSWQKKLFIDQDTGIADLKIDPNNTAILYATSWRHRRTPDGIVSGGKGSGIYKSVDGGDTWKALTTGLPSMLGKVGVSPSGAKSGLVYSIVESVDGQSGLYRSDDAGDSWYLLSQNAGIKARSWYYMDIFADPQDENTVYVLNSGFFRSIDGGKTFARVPGEPFTDNHDLWIRPSDAKNMILGDDGGAYVSLDSGASWTWHDGQPLSQIYRVNADHDVPYNIYGGQQDRNAISITSNAYNDGILSKEDYTYVGGCESGFVGVNPNNTRRVYAGCYSGLITEYDRQSKQTRNIKIYPTSDFASDDQSGPVYRFNWNAPIIVSQHNPDFIYHAANHVLRSVDRGLSWEELSPDLSLGGNRETDKLSAPFAFETKGTYGTISYLAEGRESRKTLWVGTDNGLLHVTRDGGDTWQNITPNGVKDGLFNAIEVSPHDAATVYVAYTRYKHGDDKPYIYKTSNYGRTWTLLSKTMPQNHFVRVVREDPARKGLLYAGTETGLYVSFNDGKDWQTLQLNLPHVPVTDLLLHKDDIVMSTQGRGFWLLEKRHVLWQMSPEVIKSEAHLFEPTESYIYDFNMFEFSELDLDQPNAAYIHYYLERDINPLKDSFAINIYGPEGELMRTLQPNATLKAGGSGSAYNISAQKGLNRIAWDFRTQPLTQIPNTFSTLGGSDSIVDGHRIRGGNFTIELSFNNNTLQQPLQIRLNPKLDVTDSQVAEQQAILVHMKQQLNQLHNAVNEMVNRRGALMRKTEEEGSLEKNRPQIETIIDWEERTIASKRQVWQDVMFYPSRLVEHYQDLYGAIDNMSLPVSDAMKSEMLRLDKMIEATLQEKDKILH